MSTQAPIFDPKSANTESGGDTSVKNESSIWEVRTGERPYAFLNDPETNDVNRYGQEIDLIKLVDGTIPTERSLEINGNPEIGCNPNRNKQHGFYFTADNCIGCHACEAACAEKNETPAHLSFRSVGYVEGGTYPDYKRMNISMACNHCDDPVCLKGCPTKAYTKYVEYGAVLQDPDTCFGCGYCTWVCPYNAPQLDPVKGQVSKCNMCVDRLEVGLKPACVSACVGNALDFGVVENIPQNREEAKTSIPGFPTPNISKPNVRFQQTKTLPEEMRRTDSAAIKYTRNDDGDYIPTIDPKYPKEKQWNLRDLSSRENPLVIFTLATQASFGAFVIAFVGSFAGFDIFANFNSSLAYSGLLATCFGLTAIGLFMSTVHLGKPMRFYRGFNNLRHSPVCREALGVALYFAFLGIHLLLSMLSTPAINEFVESNISSGLAGITSLSAVNTARISTGVLAALAGFIGIYYMVRCYRIPARPFWNHLQVNTAFFGTGVHLGSIIVAGFLLGYLAFSSSPLMEAINILSALILLGVAIEGLGLIKHRADMVKGGHEGATSHYMQTTRFGKTYYLRNGLFVLAAVLAIVVAANVFGLVLSLIALGLLSASVLLASVIGRALFYVLVVPTTMPGAFFWRNKGFEEHAKEIGMSDFPQVGIVKSAH